MLRPSPTPTVPPTLRDLHGRRCRCCTVGGLLRVVELRDGSGAVSCDRCASSARAILSSYGLSFSLLLRPPRGGAANTYMTKVTR